MCNGRVRGRRRSKQWKTREGTKKTKVKSLQLTKFTLYYT